MRELIDYILQQVTQMLAERGFVGTKLTGGAIRGEVPVTSIPTHPHDTSVGTKGQISHATLSNITASDHHAEVSLAASADVLLGISAQALSLDTQTANRVLAGPTSGAADVPTFRALVSADVPGGSGMATDPLWDAAGDLAVGTGADTATKLTKGTDGTLLGVVAGAVGWVTALAANFVDGAAIRLANAQWLRGRNAANTADVNMMRLNANNVVEIGKELRVAGADDPAHYYLATRAIVTDVGDVDWALIVYGLGVEATALSFDTSAGITHIPTLTVDGAIVGADLQIALNEIRMTQANANAVLYLNYHGYAGGDSQYRDLFIGDGKSGQLAFFDGSAASFWVAGNVSALSFTDRTPHYTGDALAELRGVKGDGKGKIDHKSLPKFVQVKGVKGKPDERDIGGMVTVLTVAVQQLLARVEALEAKPTPPADVIEAPVA